MIRKEIVAYRRKMLIGCDAKCEKAFGFNGRASIQLSEDADDIVWLADDEVGIAPKSGETRIYDEGGDLKPNPDFPETLLNKWCYRECERCVSCEIGDELTLKDFSQRQYNMPSKHGVNQ